jgi:hypothetical protein
MSHERKAEEIPFGWEIVAVCDEADEADRLCADQGNFSSLWARSYGHIYIFRAARLEWPEYISPQPLSVRLGGDQGKNNACS